MRLPGLEPVDLRIKRETTGKFNHCLGNDLMQGSGDPAANGKWSADTSGQAASSLDKGQGISLARVVEAWASLPPHIRETILTLVDAVHKP